ncbi:hypothetical protein PAV_5c01540 [Paenibacillus alvei DSM 29]|nr:hypothetical protein PAV_5c01540 [Paenibacillus alvei DSM 29]
MKSKFSHLIVLTSVVLLFLTPIVPNTNVGEAQIVQYSGGEPSWGTN